MRKLVIFILLASIVSLAVAQTPARANQLFEAGNYADALDMYASFVKQSPKNTLYCYRYARCLQETGRYAEAIPMFEASGTRYTLRYFYQAECEMKIWHFAEAIEMYHNYQEKATSTDKDDYIAEQIAQAEHYRRYLKRVRQIAIIDSAIVPVSQLMTAYTLSPEAGTLEQNTDGCVSYTNQRNDRQILTKSDSMSMRLMSRYRLLDTWGTEEMLPTTINFTSHQNYPFYTADGLTIYFASRDSLGFGGWDIYVSQFNTATQTYTQPENIGFPFNSAANDYLYVIDEVEKIGYFASDRFCSTDSAVVYRFRLDEEVSYVQSADADTLREYAQLRKFERLYTDSMDNSDEETVVKTERRDFYLILSDNMVYTSWNDFRNNKAKETYQQYQIQQKKHSEMLQQLEQLQKQYATATPDKRQQLAPQITTLEQQQVSSSAQLKRLINQVITQETQNTHK